MSDELHPAVRDVAATGLIDLGAGAAALAVAATVDPPGEVLLVAAVALVVAAVLAPLRLPRPAREILLEIRPAPEAAVDEGVSRAVWWTVPLVAATVGVAALLSLPVAACGAVLVGAGASALTHAWWLRRYEQLNDLRLLYRPVFRWAGTNGRALGRGWFDPANFVEAD